MLVHLARYALIALTGVACRAAEDTTRDSTTVQPDSVATVVQSTPAEQGTPAPPPPAKTNPSLDPTDTVPVRRAPPTTQMIIDTATLPTIQNIVAHHPQRVDSVITAMTADMKRANRAPSAAFTALQDSVRKDLDKLASIGNGELVAFFRVHYARFTRLMQAGGASN
jgi:hypothetical protein